MVLQRLFGRRSKVHGPADVGSSSGTGATVDQAPGYYRMRVGEAIVTTLHDGSNERGLDGLVRNATVDEVEAQLAQECLPPGKFTTFYNSFLIDIGGRRVLIDPGFADNGPPTAGQLAQNMAAAGVTPESIDVVAVTHFHPDHIQGIRSKAGALVYPNATLMVPDQEWAYWMDDARAASAAPGLQPTFAAARRVFGPIADTVVRFAWGQESVPGLTSVAVPGHAPGMSGFMLQSGSERLLVQADVTNLPALFMRRPGWHLMFDMDPVQAEATRRRIFDMVSTEKIPVMGFHYPFPAIGRVSRDGDGYRLHLLPWRSSV